MIADDIRALVAKALDPLLTELAEARLHRQDAEGAAELAVVDEGVATAVRRSGQFRPGAESIILARARSAGWTNVDGQLLRVADGEIVDRDIGEWLADNRVSLAMILEPGQIDPADRQAFRENLEAIASGERQVGPLPR